MMRLIRKITKIFDIVVNWLVCVRVWWVCVCVRQWTESSLVHMMACHLFGTKALSEPMLTYCQLDPYERNLEKSKSKYFSFKKKLFEYIVFKMVVVLPRPLCVNIHYQQYPHFSEHIIWDHYIKYQYGCLFYKCRHTSRDHVAHFRIISCNQGKSVWNLY